MAITFLILFIANFCNVMSIDMTLQKWAIFIIGVYVENLCLSSDQAEILFLVIHVYRKNVETHNESFSKKKQVIKKLLPKNP